MPLVSSKDVEKNLAGDVVLEETNDSQSTAKKYPLGPIITDHALLSKHARYVYSRDFLMSFADLDHCRLQPIGINSVLLRDNAAGSSDRAIVIPASSCRGLIWRERDIDALSEASDLPERRKPSSHSGSSSLHEGPRRIDLSVNNGDSRLRPNWGDTGSERTTADRARRWEPKSRTHAGRDTVDPRGCLHGAGLSSAHAQDGLLGTGSPIHHQGGVKSIHQIDKHCTLEQAGGKYHGHGGKAREDFDLVNDETFGSIDGYVGPISEQEHQRRELFEQMRKEQKNKLNDVGIYEVHGRKQDDLWICGLKQSNKDLLSFSPSTPSKDRTMKAQNSHLLTTQCPVITPSKDRTMKAQNSHLLTTQCPVVFPGFSKAAVCISLKELSQDNKDLLPMTQDDDWCSLLPSMSKFAHLFPNEETYLENRGPTNGIPENSSNISSSTFGLTSLNSLFEAFDGPAVSSDPIQASITLVPSLFPAKSKGKMAMPMPIGPFVEDVEKALTANSIGSTSASVSIKHQSGAALSNEMHKEPNSHPLFLMCEDVEQHLLTDTIPHYNEIERTANSERGKVERNLDLNALFQGWLLRDSGHELMEGSGAALDDIDNDASRHLMFLLQKGSSTSENTSILKERDSSSCGGGGKTIESDQLKVLFGKSFMNDLHSVGKIVLSNDLPIKAKIENVFQALLHELPENNSGGLSSDSGIEDRFGVHIQQQEGEQNKLKNLMMPQVYDASWSELSPHSMLNAGGFDVSDPRYDGPFPCPMDPLHVAQLGHPFHPAALPVENFYSPTPHMNPKLWPFGNFYKSQLDNDNVFQSMGMHHTDPAFLEGHLVQTGESIQASWVQHVDEHLTLQGKGIKMSKQRQEGGVFNLMHDSFTLEHFSLFSHGKSLPMMPILEGHRSLNYELEACFQTDGRLVNRQPVAFTRFDSVLS